jgi:uncharacterized protein
MNISRYTFLINNKKGTFVYNSLSNSLAKIPIDLFQKLDRLKNIKFSEHELEEDAETLLQLKKSFIIVENEPDDLLQYQAATWSQRKTENIYNITVAPTMDCNFKCYYCFEEHQKLYINEDIIQRIAKYINGITNAIHINFTWFGGEPLMAFEQMKALTYALKIPEKTSTAFDMITNGYFLTEDVTDELKNMNIKQIQLSIDGLFDDYNKVKFMKTDKSCFERVLKNIDCFSKKHHDIQLAIRVNMNKTSKENFLTICRFFRDRYLDKKNIVICPAFLKNIDNTTTLSRAKLFSDGEDKIRFYLDMYQQTKDKNILYPSNRLSECAVRNHNSWAFGPDGSIYKCWEVIGDEKYKVGELDINGKIQITNNLLLARYMYGADPLCNSDCQLCRYLPICYGGCPQQRIREDFESAPIENCSKDTDYIEKYLTQIINNQ